MILISITVISFLFSSFFWISAQMTWLHKLSYFIGKFQEVSMDRITRSTLLVVLLVPHLCIKHRKRDGASCTKLAGGKKMAPFLRKRLQRRPVRVIMAVHRALGRALQNSTRVKTGGGGGTGGIGHRLRGFWFFSTQSQNVCKIRCSQAP